MSPVWLAYDPADVRPGWGALILILVLAFVIYLLWRSMNTQLGRIQMPPSRRPDNRIGEGYGAAEPPDEATGDDSPPPPR